MRSVEEDDVLGRGAVVVECLSGVGVKAASNLRLS